MKYDKKLIFYVNNLNNYKSYRFYFDKYFI